jgi:cytochrome c peroxidase
MPLNFLVESNYQHMRYFTLIVAVLLVLNILSLACGENLPPLRGPLGLNPSTKQIALGQMLFFDGRLSADGTVACATCHDPKLGWSDGLPVAVGIQGLAGTRNSPTVLNASYSPLMFHDGRTVGQITQALLPLVNRVEMGNQNEQQVIRRLQLVPRYQALFAEAFDPITYDRQTLSPITQQNLAFAIAAFETTIVSSDAPVDRFRDGDEEALTSNAKIGYTIFQAAGCMRCHIPPLYTDNLFHNNGMETASRTVPTDSGRFGVVAQQNRTNDTVRAFKTPTLREIQRTAPYGHNGRFNSLRDVLNHYNRGGASPTGIKDRFTDRRIQPMRLSASQLDYMEMFLREGFSSSSYPMVSSPVLP